MNIIFFGNHLYGHASLTHMLQRGFRPVLVIANVPRKGENIWYPSVEALAKQHDIEVVAINQAKGNSDLVEKVKSFNPDLFVVSSYRSLLDDELLHVPAMGSINLHMAPLPKYRGVHPENWAIINGETEMGYTVHYLDSGIDSGDIIVQDYVNIFPEDDILSLTFKLAQAGPQLLTNVLRDLSQGIIVKEKQNSSEASYFPPRKPEHGEVQWALPAIEIQRLVRALVRPYPGAFTSLCEEKMIIWKVVCLNETDHSASPGTIIDFSSEGILVATGTQPILIREFEWSGSNLNDCIGKSFGEKKSVKESMKIL